MAWAEDLKRTSFHSFDKCLFDQWLILFQSLSFKKTKTYFFFLPMGEDIRRYFLVPIMLEIPRNDIMCCFISFVAWGLKKTLDLWKLTSCLEALPYVSRILVKVLDSTSIALQNRKQSATNEMCVKVSVL